MALLLRSLCGYPLERPEIEAYARNAAGQCPLFDLEIELKNVILVEFRFFAFLRSQGQRATFLRRRRISALSLESELKPDIA